MDIFDLVIISKNLEKVVEFGNTAGNLQSGGIVTQKGNMVYYVNYADSNKLYKMQLDGTSRTKLSEETSVYNINVVDDWVYYRTNYDFGPVYKVRTNGTDKVKLIDEDVYNIYVRGSWIYYSTSNGLYKIKTDGTQKATLVTSYISGFDIKGEWIYLTMNDPATYSLALFKMRIDGSELTNINQDYAVSINVVDNWIYYTILNDGVYKIKLDGTSRTKLTNYSVTSINVVDEYIYYVKSDNSRIYRMQTNGTGDSQIGDWYTYKMNIAGDWIYSEENMAWRYSFLSRVNKDGSNYGIMSNEVLSIEVSPSSIELKVGEVSTLTAAIKPEYASNKKVVWSSNNESIVAIDQLGKITAISEGTAIITVTSEDGNKTSQCSVTVVSN